MAEIAFEGFNNSGYHSGIEVGFEWGLDGWTFQDVFELMITTDSSVGKASLTLEQCSQLAATLIEHIKEVRDASEENTN